MSRGWYEGGNASSPHNGSLFFAVTGARGGEEEFLREGGGGGARVTFAFVFISIFYFSPTRVSSSEFSVLCPFRLEFRVFTGSFTRLGLEEVSKFEFYLLAGSF